MPALTEGELTLLRTHPHRVKEYLAVLQPATIMTCILDGTPSGDPVTQVDYTGAVGDYADIVPGMTLWVGTEASPRSKGTCRVRKAPTSSVLYVAEDSAIDWLDGDYLTVVENYELWVKYPRIVANDECTFYKDWEETYSDQHSNWPPVAVMGSPDCQFVDADTGLATCQFVGEFSYPVAPGATISSYSWTFPGGTPDSSAAEGTEAVPIEITWDTPGRYWVTLTVTDSNGKIHTGRRPVFIFPADRNGEGAPYSRFKMAGRSGDLDSHGHTANFEIHGDADQAEFPDRALVVYFTEDWYGDTKGSIGGNFPYRSHIKFVGYISRESTTKDPQTSTVTFEAATIHAQMGSREGFSSWIKEKTSADNWCEATYLTADRAALSLCRHNSTLLDIADVITTGNTLRIKSQEFAAKTTLLQQLQTLYDDLFAFVACDKQGRVYFEIDPQMLAVADRAGIPIVATVTHADWREKIDLPRPQEPQISFVNLAGVYYPGAPNEVAPVLSKAPGDAPAYMGSPKEISGLILAGQSDGNEKAGLAMARDNNEFPEVTLPMAGLWDVFDIVPQEYIRFSLAVEDTKRGIVWTDQKLIPRRVELRMEDTPSGRIPKVDITAEKDSYGPSGVDGDYPNDVPPVGPYIPPTYPGPPAPPGGEEGDGNLLYFIDNTSGHLFRTRNAREPVAANVAYEDLGYVGAGLRHIVLDPWNPKNSAVIVAAGHVFKTTNLDSALPTWTLISTAATDYQYFAAAASICQQGLWMVTGDYVNWGAGARYPFYIRSLDGGETWTSPHLFGGEGATCRPEFSAHAAGTAWIVTDRAVATIYTYKTTNVTVAPPTNPTWTGYPMFTTAWSPLVPASYHRFLDNPSDLIALYGGNEQPFARVSFCNADVGTCIKTTLDAGNVNAMTAQVGGYTWGTNKYWALTTDPSAGYRFHVSDDGLIWTMQYDFVGTVQFISGWPYDGEFFYACQNGAVAPMGISNDRGATWQAQTGNWAELGYTGDIRCCVPVWVA